MYVDKRKRNQLKESYIRSRHDVNDKIGKTKSENINHPYNQTGVLTGTRSFPQESSNQQKVFPVLFHQGILRADRLWLTESRDLYSYFSCLVL